MPWSRWACQSKRPLVGPRPGCKLAHAQAPRHGLSKVRSREPASFLHSLTSIDWASPGIQNNSNEKRVHTVALMPSRHLARAEQKLAEVST